MDMRDDETRIAVARRILEKYRSSQAVRAALEVLEYSEEDARLLMQEILAQGLLNVSIWGNRASLIDDAHNYATGR